MSKKFAGDQYLRNHAYTFGVLTVALIVNIVAYRLENETVYQLSFLFNAAGILIEFTNSIFSLYKSEKGKK